MGIQKMKAFNVHRLLISFWSSLSFIGLGSSALVFGPTMLDLASTLNVGIGVLSAMFGCRALGGGVGSVGAGVAMDKLTNYSYTMLASIILSSILSTIAVPLSINVYMLAIFMFLNGVALGALDSGTHAILMRLWKDKSGPCMQILHFAFGFGAFTAPVIAKHFISEERNNCIMDENATSSILGSGCSWNETDTEAESVTRFKLAYFITSSLFLPTLLAYSFYALKYDILGKCCTRYLRSTQDLSNSKNKDESEVELHNLDTEQSSKDDPISAKDEDKISKSSKRIKRLNFIFNAVLLTLLSVFLFVYVGLEVTYGSLIFVVVVTGELDFAKSQGTVIQSLFWGTFAFCRLFSILLALFKVRSSVMMSGNLFGSIVAATIMVSFIHNAPAIWLGSAVLGMSYASIYPTAMTWMSENMEPTGLATAMLITGGVLGDITFPSIVGLLVAKTSPNSLFYITFAGILISALIVTIMFATASMKKKKGLSSIANSDLSEGSSGLVLKVNGDMTKLGEEGVRLMDAEGKFEEESNLS